MPRSFFLASLCLVIMSACRSSAQAGACDPPLTPDHLDQIEDGRRCGDRLAACHRAVQGARTPAPAEAPVPEPESAFEVKVGATYMLGQGNQTVVMNPKPVDDGLRRFAKGAICRFDPNATAKIIARHATKADDGSEEVDYLVRYARDPAPEALREGALEHPDSEPYECPTGTVFFLDDPSILEDAEIDPRFEAARKLLDSEKP